MKIEHNFFTKDNGSDGIAAIELWIDLPNGKQLYFEQIEYHWSMNKQTRMKLVEDAKKHIIESLMLLCK